MAKIYDIVIIGAGPSGSSCAYNLKRFHPDLSILLIDKAQFPRYKTCGGGISPEVQNYLDFDLSPAIDFSCQQAVMVAQSKQICSDKYPIWMTRREIFDEFLLHKAQQQGVEVLTGCNASDINLDQKTISTTLGRFSSRIIVLAEGSLGNLMRKLVFNKKNNIFAAMEYEHYTTNLSDKLFIDFDQNERGYAWNFPKSDGISVGYGAVLKGKDKKNSNIPSKLKHYVQQFGINEFHKQHLHGQPIQLYSGRRKLVHGSLLLIGEIAGCVDPLTAEGIRPAIKSGYLAAQVISDAFKRNNLNLIKNYDHIFHQHIGHDFQYARVFSYFLNNHMQKILPYLNSKIAIDTFLHVFSGQSTYSEHITFSRLLRLGWKVFRYKM